MKGGKGIVKGSGWDIRERGKRNGRGMMGREGTWVERRNRMTG